ncbi:MAG: type II toxin-antitoxin system PemK/MazF family toxin [Defluviitaleaceae bacterium]|nr:type II toxin-antitoxin system PemK/MazF family toxin [Defluviitaleaceae bacterium]
MINQGDILWLDLNPQSGHEQKGRRPVVVVSNNDFHFLTGGKFAMVCPITNKARGHFMHIALNEQTETTGYVMCEQAKVLDIHARNYTYIEKMPTNIFESVWQRVRAII